MNKQYVRNGLQYSMQIEPLGGYEYEYQMLLENKIDHLLPLQVEFVNQRQLLIYPVQNAKPFWITSETMWISKQQLYSIVDSLLHTIEEVRRYLLDADNLILETDCLFWDLNQYELHMIYVPGYKRDILKQMTELTEKLLSRMDHQDKNGIYFAHGLHRLLKEETVDLEEIRAYLKNSLFPQELVKNEKESVWREPEQNKNVIKQEIEQETVSSFPERKDWKLWLAGVLGVIMAVGAGFILYLIYWYGIEEWKRDVLLVFLLFFTADCLWGMTQWNRRKKEKEMIDVIQIAEQKKERERRREQGQEASLPVAGERWDGQAGDTIVLGCEEGRLPVNVPKLIPLEKEKKEEILIKKTPFVIGNYHTGVDYRIQAGQISRFHVAFSKIRNDYYIKDLHSTNGTYVNHIQIEPGEEVFIKKGDKITLANLEYLYQTD